MNKNLFFLCLTLITLSLSSCKKDTDPQVEEEKAGFTFTFDWQQEFFDFAEVEGMDSLPSKFDLTWDTPNIITEDEVQTATNFAVYAYDDGIIDGEQEDQAAHILVANYSTAKDSVLMLFRIFGGLKEQSYEMVATDLFSTELIPDNKVVPYAIITNSQIGSEFSLSVLFGAFDYTGSTFNITEIDEENKEISGNFTFDWKLIDEDSGNTYSVLKVEDGVFNKIPQGAE